MAKNFTHGSRNWQAVDAHMRSNAGAHHNPKNYGKHSRQAAKAEALDADVIVDWAVFYSEENFLANGDGIILYGHPDVAHQMALEMGGYARGLTQAEIEHFQSQPSVNILK